MKKLFLAVLLLVAGPAYAQVLPKQSFNVSGTVAVTNTFQSVQANNPGRLGCVIENNGTHTMYVYFGTCSNATTSNSAQIPASASISCANPTGSVILTDQICLTGTAADVYFANFQ